MKALVVSRRSLIAAAAVAAVAACIAAGAFALSSVSAAAPNGMTVVVDPGHGGADGGVLGTDSGVKEADVNLGIALSLRHFLREAGFNVVMTRDSDRDLAKAGESFKQSDMRERKRIIEEAAPDLVVSVHQNYYPLRSVSGAQVFYAEGSEKGEEDAELMQNVLSAALGSDRAPKSADYYIINCTGYPSLLIECGFMSNAAEEALLVTPEYQRRVAYAICSGVVGILLPFGSQSAAA